MTGTDRENLSTILHVDFDGHPRNIGPDPDSGERNCEALQDFLASCGWATTAAGIADITECFKTIATIKSPAATMGPMLQDCKHSQQRLLI